MKNWKQFLSLLMVFIMCFNLMPLSVLAEDNVPETNPAGEQSVITTPAPTDEIVNPEEKTDDEIVDPNATKDDEIVDPDAQKDDEVVAPDAKTGDEIVDTDEPDTSAVDALQARIDALVIPNEDDYDSAKRYEAALAALEAELRSITDEALKLTDEQLDQIDGTKSAAAQKAIDEYYYSTPSAIAVTGSGDSATDPYIIENSTGSIKGSDLYTEFKTLGLTEGKILGSGIGYYVNGSRVKDDTTESFSSGPYEIFKAKRSGASIVQGDSLGKWIQINKAAAADMTLKGGTYTVKANLDTYANLTAQQIIDAAVATSNGTVTVSFRYYKPLSVTNWTEIDRWEELTSANLSNFLASEDKTSFRLICGNTTEEITVNFEESRVNRTVTYGGTTPIEYVDEASLVAAVKAGLNPQVDGTTVALVSVPDVGTTGDAEFTVTVPGDVDYFTYEGSLKVSVKMPAAEYNISVKAEGEGAASASAEKSIAGKNITISYAANDTDGSDGSVGYLKSITVNGTAIEGNTFTMPEADAEVVVTFGTRSISITEAPVVYMNSSKGTLGISHDEYKENMVVSNVAYTVSGEGAESAIYLEMQYSGIGGNKWAKIDDLGLAAATACDLPSADKEVTKSIRLVWPAEGNLPEVMATATVTIKDSYRAVTYMDGESTLSTVGTELNAVYEINNTPTKDGHTFDGWTDGTTDYANGDTITITDNVTLTAKWTVNSYTVTWVDGDGNTLETDTVKYGETPEYNGAAPTKTQTESTVYTWNKGWDKEVAAVTDNVTYTATFTEAAREYTLTFNKENGDLHATLSVAYGTEPNAIEGIPAVPAKEATAQYTYTANEWGVEKVTGDATYTASYTETLRSYTVTWVNDDNTELYSETVAYGTVPTYGGEDPTKTATDEYTYTFAGWDNEVVAVAGNVTYKATYTAAKNSYTITWNAGDGKFADGSTTKTTTVAYGETPVAPAEPAKAADGETEWKFGGWGTITSVTGEASYTATYTRGDAVEYKVTWYDEDGTTVLHSADWAYGSAPSYEGETPTKAATAQYTYTFDKWVAVSGVADNGTITGEASYKASYTATVNKYTVTWIIDGTEYKDSVAYGTVPTCGHSTDKEATAKFTYTFKGWDNEVVAVTDHVTYTAVYTETVNKYTITWVDGNGEEIKTEEVAYGETPAYTGEAPTKAQTKEEVFTFNGKWSPAIVPVEQAASYTAQFDAAARPYTITWVNGDGTTVTAEVPYGATPEYKGETPTKAAEGNFTYTFAGWDAEPAAVTGEATYKAKFTANLAADNGTLYINGSYSEKLLGLKEKVLTAALPAEYNADEYTVKMVTRLGSYNVESTNVLDQTAMFGALNIGDTQSFEIIHSSGAAKTVAMSIAEARLQLNIVASQETIEFSGKTEIANIPETVKALFSITSTDPVTGEVTKVNVSDDYITWSPAYAWPADAETDTFTVTCKVNSIANEVYGNAPSASVTVTLTDTTVIYTVTYVDGYNTENNVVAEYKIAENLDTKTPEADPTREFYTFAGWTPVVADKVTKNVTYTAAWTVNNDNNGNSIADETELYTVVYVLGNGEENVVFENLAWGEDTPAVEAPVREGYNFKGWDVNPAAAVSAPAEGNTITYTAQWTAAHAVIFMNNGVQYDTAEVVNGALLTEPAAPAWDEDHDFLYWYIMDNGHEVEYNFANQVTANMTLYAKWRDDFNRNDIEDASEAHYDVVYDVDGVLTTHNNVLVGMNTPAMDAPSKTGFIFAGWAVNGEITEVAATVTEAVTYVAQWLNDTNGNNVDDALETITVEVVGNGTVTMGLKSYANGDTYVYDSTAGRTLTVVATPKTGLSGLKQVSSSYVAGIALDGTAAELNYGTTYAVTYEFTATGSHALKVEFADIAFAYNEERLLNFYPGLPGVVLDDVYNTIVDTPDLPGEYTLKYFARPAMSQTVQLSSLGISDTLLNVLKLINFDTIPINLPELWLDVEVNDLSDKIENAYSLDQAVSKYMTVERIEGLWDVFQNGGGLTGGGLNAVKAEIELITQQITDAAMYYGAHSFGYNDTESETVTEQIKVTYGCDAFYIEGQTDITLKDLRETSYILGSNVSVMYKDFTDEELVALIGAYAANADGVAIEGASVTAADIIDPYTFEGKYASDTAYELTFRYSGNDQYKPSTASFAVTVTKASASVDVPNVTVNYGEGYSMLSEQYFTLGNKFGDAAEIADSMIQFVIGLDVADLDVNADGVNGLNSRVQLILPDDLQSMLDSLIGITGGNSSDGMEMSLSELTKYLEPIEDESLGVLKQALSAIQSITETGDITIVLGGALPTDIGAYLYGAVSTSSNYQTAFDVAYIVIKPDATRVYLNWNYTDTQGVFTYDLLKAVDMGASAFADAQFTSKHDEANALVQNLVFGVDVEGNLVAELVPQGDTVNASELSLGAYTQLAFIAEFGNEMYYAVPLVRAFVIISEIVEVTFVDENGAENRDRHFVFDDNAHALDVVVTSKVDGEVLADTRNPDEPRNKNLSIYYAGVQTNGQLYKSSEAPSHSGAYAVTATYTVRGDDGYIAQLGADIGAIVIEPAQSDIAVSNKTHLYDGKSVTTSDMIQASSVVPGQNPDVTVITAAVTTDGTFSENGLSAVEGPVNADLPKWLDELLHRYGIDAGYTEAGITKEVMISYLTQLEAILAEEGMPADMLTGLKKIVEQLPANTKITLKEQAEVAPTAIGAYLVIGVVTDANHYPSFGAGMLIIYPEMVEATLEWNYVDDNGIFKLPNVLNPEIIDLSAKALVDGKELTDPQPNEVYLGVDADNWTIQLVYDQTKLTNGVYTEFAYLLQVDNTTYYAEPISRTFAIVPETVVVTLEGETPVVYDGASHGMTAQVTDNNGNVIATDDTTLTYRYMGIQANGELYNSKLAPVHAGTYQVMAVYTSFDETGKLVDFGADVKNLTIRPAQSDVTVESRAVAFGTTVAAGDMITVSGAVEGDPIETTVISAQIATDGTFSENGLSALQGQVNVDFPAWLDAYLKEIPVINDGYESSINGKTFKNKVAAVQSQLTELGVDAAMLDAVVTMLDQIPEGVELTFKDDMVYSAVGTYLVVAVTTDADYVPAMDAGFLAIYPNVDVSKLEWKNVDENNIFYRDLLVDNPGYLDAVYVNDPSVDAVELYLGIDEANWLLHLDNKQPDTVGIYTELAYVADTNANAHYALPIIRSVVVVDGIYVVQILDENGKVNHDRLFTYDGDQQPIGDIYIKGYGMDTTDIPAEDTLTVKYVGVDTMGNTWNSSVPPTNAGIYTVSVIYVDRDPATNEIIGGGAALGTMVVQIADLALDMKDTTVEYDAQGHFVDVSSNNDEADYLTIIVDKQANVMNIILEDDLTLVGGALKTLLEKALGRSLDNEFSVTEVQTAIHKVIDEVEAFTIPEEMKDAASKLPEEVQAVLKDMEAQYDVLKAELDAALAEIQTIIPVEGTVVFNGELPVNVGTYQFYGVAISENYAPELTEGELTIVPAQVVITIDDKTMYAGDELPEFTYTVDSELAKQFITVSAYAPFYVPGVAGQYDIVATYTENPNFLVKVVYGTLTVLEPAKTGKSIQFPADGPVQPGDVVEIDGVEYPVDEDGKIWVDDSFCDDLIATSYDVNANSGAATPDSDAELAAAHKAYPKHMYVWYVEYDEETGSYLAAEEITDLRDFFTYAGTSIRYSTNLKEKHGIRIITSVSENARKKLINGELVGHEALKGWKLVEYGTVFKNVTKAALPEGMNIIYTGQGTGNASVAYGEYKGKQLDRVFSKSGGKIQFTGMLTDLEDELLDDELLMRPYMVLESPTGEQVTIHGGSLQRSIGYVAWQNRNFNGTGAKAFIQNIIEKVYG